jgi:F0F1-type ATP synthase gamma subunit
MEFDEIVFCKIKEILTYLWKLDRNSKPSVIKKFHEKCIELKSHPSFKIYFENYDYNEYLTHCTHLFDSIELDYLLGVAVCIAEIYKKKNKTDHEDYCYNYLFNNLWFLCNMEKYINPMRGIPKTLNNNNIDDVIAKYLEMVSEIDINTFDSTIDLINFIKRGKTAKGPYPYVSLSESSNRIMTDLVILFGIKNLLNGIIPEIRFKEYFVDFGNENSKKHDILVIGRWGTYLVGEAFNVSRSLFKAKKRNSVKKLRNSQMAFLNQFPQSCITKAIIIYNSDANNKIFTWKLENDIYYLPIDLNKYII